MDALTGFIEQEGLFTTFVVILWDDILKAAILAAFIAFVSRPKEKPVRRFLSAVGAAILMYAASVFFEFFVSYNLFLRELREVSFILILFLASLACGEKSPFRALSFSLIAVNVSVVTESVLIGSLAAQRPLTILSGSIALSAYQRGIAAFATALILFGAAVFFRKYRAELERKEKIALLTSLSFLTLVVLLTRNILTTNLDYYLRRFFSIYSTQKTVVYCVVILGAVLLLNASVYVIFVRISIRNKEKAEQAILAQKYRGQNAIIEEVSKQHEKVSRMRHDLLNTLGTVDGLIASGRTDEAREFIRSHTGTLSADVRAVNTDNEYVNSLISYKSSQAKENGVEVSVYATSNIVFPDNADLCNLIGNMLDNGINAAAKCETEKDVRLDITRDGDAYRISVLNSVPSPVLKTNPQLVTSSPDRLSHGYGMKIIREIAEKYYGTTDCYDTDDGKFCCTAVLYPSRPY
ncbi:MAG: sensor histidine kinase [Clostridia bacterium]|nr:sensor histidine kinase [Clostridia bacterium]